MSTMTVDRKVAVGAFAGALLVILGWGLEEFAGVPLPNFVAQAAQMVIVFVVQWAVPGASSPPSGG